MSKPFISNTLSVVLTCNAKKFENKLENMTVVVVYLERAKRNAALSRIKQYKIIVKNTHVPQLNSSTYFEQLTNK